ncbi:SpoIIAA family protein [Marinirhabdus gelatinilytica]|uniref:SpoIIAA-like protein n=1 Tax=Marinirhabdus gelatinilytica TaxID=1703343 RepID=A0A370QL77_9FLAO|nr:STAS/SEC14 domain-containing protein [Marinirhabdus gelatinilytica]RDK89135.1 SpoIIAA-like protein [Marinirhabdus gelatinilytica]
MHPSFSFSEETVGFLIEDGVFDKERSEELFAEISKKIKRFGKINLYLEDQGIDKFTLPAISDNVLFKHENKEKLNKVALVSDRKWIHACATVENLFLPIAVKSFTVDERMEAMSWIMEK